MLWHHCNQCDAHAMQCNAGWRLEDWRIGEGAEELFVVGDEK